MAGRNKHVVLLQSVEGDILINGGIDRARPYQRMNVHRGDFAVRIIIVLCKL